MWSPTNSDRLDLGSPQDGMSDQELCVAAEEPLAAQELLLLLQELVLAGLELFAAARGSSWQWRSPSGSRSVSPWH